MKCNACGNENQGEVKFCGHCGAKLKDGDATKLTAKKVLSTVATLLIIATAVSLVVSVFFIGTASSSTLFAGIPELSGLMGKPMGIYDFFGLMYKGLGDALADAEAFEKFVLIFPRLLTTLAFTATLILVIVFSAFAMVSATKKLMGKSKNSGGKYAIKAFVSYVVGAVLIKALAIAVLGMENSVSVGFNTATKAGIAVSSVLLGLCLACAFASRGSALLDKKLISNTIFTLCGIALAAVVLALVSGPAYTMNAVSDYGYTSVSVSTKVGYLAMLEGFTDGDLNIGAIIMLIFAYLFSVGASVIAALLIERGCRFFLVKKQDASLVMPIVLCVLAFVAMICAIVAGVLLMSEDGASEAVQLWYTVPVVAVVMAAINIVMEVGKGCMGSYFARTPAAAN